MSRTTVRLSSTTLPGNRAIFSVPTPRAFSAEPSRRSIDTEHASSAESFQRTPKLLVEVCDSHLIVGSVT